MADISKITALDGVTYDIKDADARAALGNKQDTISDLSTIRSGAALGATAVQPETGKGLFSGAYDDLTGKPTIPPEVSESTVSGWGFTKNTGTVTTTGTMTANHVVVSNGSTVIKDSGYTIAKSIPSDAVFTDTTYESKTAVSGGTAVSLVTTGEKYTWNNKGTYSKPSGGIPSSDMASAVQSSLSKADTAVQPEAGKGLFSGNYNDLTNKPTIPPAVTETTVSGWGFTKNTGTYSKPSDGIPKTDLASAVQTSLGLADTALQSFSETDPTVPSWAKQTSKPTYTKSEVGLGNVGNFKAVSTVANQGLTDTEKSNARTNIGAGTYSKPNGGIPDSDLASTFLKSSDISGKENTSNKVTSISASSTDTQYPSAKCIYTLIGNIETLLSQV